MSPILERKLIYKPSPKATDIAYLLRTVAFATRLSYKQGTAIMKERENEMRESFSVNGIPVVVCAWNEEKDLPRLLFALSKSSNPIRPIIINNGSTDGTADIAHTLQIEVVEEPKSGLVNAQSAAIRYIRENKIDKKVIFTDADNIPGKLWAKHMNEQLDKFPETGGLLFGLYLYYGGSILSDQLLSLGYFMNTIGMYLRQDKVSGHVGNFGIKFDKNGKIAGALINTPKNTVTGNGTLTRDTVILSGGKVKRNLHPFSLMLTRSDRIPNLSSVFHVVLEREATIKSKYADWRRRQPDGVDYKTKV